MASTGSNSGRGGAVRVGALLATMAVGATGLAACGSSAPVSQKATSATSTAASTATSKKYAGKTLTVLIGAATSNIAANNTFNNAVASAFHAATGATLKYETYTSASTELTKIETSVVSHSGPDVMNLGSTLVPSAYATHAFAVLSPSDWSALGGKSAFYSQQLKMAGPSPSSYIGVPVDAVPFAMAYNTALFKKAGISGPPKTWSQYVSDAQKINDPAKGVYGTAIAPADPYEPWKDYWTFVRQLGGRFISSNRKTSQLDSPKMVQAVKFLFDWYTKFHIVNPNSLTWKETNAIDAFAAGKVGELTMQTVSAIPTYVKGAIGKNYAFAPPPSVPYGMSSAPSGSQPASTIVSGQFDVVANYAPKALALQYLRVATSKKIQEMQWKLLKELPVTTSAGKAVEGTNPTIVKPFISSLEHADPTAFVGAWGTVEAAIAAATSKLATKIATTKTLPTPYINSVLKTVNASVQAQL